MPEQKIIDLGEAALYLTYGFNLIRLENTKNSRGIQFKVFVFEETHPQTQEEIKDIGDLYYESKLKIDAYTFYRSLKELKTRIHQGV